MRAGELDARIQERLKTEPEPPELSDEIITRAAVILRPILQPKPAQS